ncbi:hypothetical protein CQ13_38775 [Bradyrhizobium retamae]|uniref:Uncharacterized protein n=1 Tax=Bradyrhizobium retamae TaxID=1300035 RepID=A0A0R3NBI3_9BRAD|nr:hypothetical protein CQ13_38775 [Bradyrhizobium retamae]
MRDSAMPASDIPDSLPATVRPTASRTTRLGESQLAIGFAVGDEPWLALSPKLAMPISGDTLLRIIRSALLPDFVAQPPSASTIGLGVVASDIE